MSWFRVDDMSAFHAKIVKAGNAAWGALCRMGANSSHYGDDGFVSIGVAKLIATDEEIAALLHVELLEEADGGYQIHDYLDWNPSAAKLASIGKKRAKAGKQGGANAAAKRQANAVANAPASASPIAQANDNQKSSKGYGSGSGISDLGEGMQGGTVTTAPDDIPITDAIRGSCAMAGAKEPTVADVQACLANARKKGHVRADWGAELTSWMIRGRLFVGRNGTANAPESSVNHPSRQRIQPIKRPPADSAQAAIRGAQEPAGGPSVSKTTTDASAAPKSVLEAT